MNVKPTYHKRMIHDWGDSETEDMYWRTVSTSANLGPVRLPQVTCPARNVFHLPPPIISPAQPLSALSCVNIPFQSPRFGSLTCENLRRQGHSERGCGGPRRFRRDLAHRRPAL